MTADELRAVQAPLKQRYKDDPAAARVSMRAEGCLGMASVSCTVESASGAIDAGLHPAAGGDGSWACSGDMLLQSLVACAGVTLKAVATAMSIPLKGGTIIAEGDMDFRGTLGVSRETPVGMTAIRLTFHLDSDAPAEQLDKLVQLAERYCVIYQTLKSPAVITAELRKDTE